MIQSMKRTLFLRLLLATLVMASGLTLLLVWLEPSFEGDLLTGLWWMLTTLTTVGYGDVVPLTPLGRVLAFGVVALSVVIFSLVTARLSVMLIASEVENEERELLDRLKQVQQHIEKREALDTREVLARLSDIEEQLKILAKNKD
jgi:voltage-gated potassium channel